MEKKIIVFEHVVYRKNLFKDVYLFCLRRNKTILNYLILLPMWKIFFVLGRLDEQRYCEKRWSFLEKSMFSSGEMEKFWKRKKQKLRKRYINTGNIYITSMPAQIFKGLDINIAGNDYDVEKKEFSEYNSLEETYRIVREGRTARILDAPKSKVKRLEESDRRNIVWGGICYPKRSYYIASRILENVVKVGVIYRFSILVTKMSLWYASILYGGAMYQSYFKNEDIFRLNFYPVVIVGLFFWLLFKRVWAGVLISSVLSLGIAWINYYKLLFRDDVLVFADIRLFSEGMTMAGKYNLVFEKEMLKMTLIVGVVTGILFILSCIREVEYSKIRFIGCILIVGISVYSVKNIYFGDEYYVRTMNEELINKWFATDQYVSKGCLYPFIRSAKDIIEVPPEGYNKRDAKEELEKFESQDIPEEKKVNVISIMLEAFNDFSEFPEVEFERDPYMDLHAIEEEAYSGELVTNIFAAGTINTEHLFLSGTVHELEGRIPENTYVRYFKEQGYQAEGSHPSYEKFYNRLNVNENYGFENYYFMENRYGLDEKGDLLGDDLLFPDIVKLYEEGKKSGKPYFNFSVTYQNHGPYSTDPAEISYLKWKEGYTKAEYNILNNYFAGIENTCHNLKQMTETLKEDEAPVVLIFFGDHNPWGGDNNSAYNMLDINLDVDEEEGFYNYYDTKYVIWANDAAKKILGNDFEGQGPAIGPYFLMNEFFSLAGWKGNDYMQAANLLKEDIQVVHEFYYQENGELVHELSEEGEKILHWFENIEYYYRKNYRY